MTVPALLAFLLLILAVFVCGWLTRDLLGDFRE